MRRYINSRSCLSVYPAFSLLLHIIHPLLRKSIMLFSTFVLMTLLVPAFAAALPKATKTSSTAKNIVANTGTASGNPFIGKKMHSNEYYSSQVVHDAIPSLPSSLKAAATKVAEMPSFFWMLVPWLTFPFLCVTCR